MIKKIGDLAIDEPWDNSNWSAIMILYKKVEEIFDTLNSHPPKPQKEFLTCECPYCNGKYWWGIETVIEGILKELRKLND